MEMDNFGSALDKKATEMTVVDVYDMAAVVGQEFERLIDRYGREVALRLMPKVVRILELLEVLVSRSAVSPEADELRRELDRMRQERSDRQDKDRQHQKELELVEDLWRGEIQDMLTKISQLQSENNRLLSSLSTKVQKPSTDQEPPREEGRSEREQQRTNEMRDMVNKQRHQLCAKDHELSRRSEDVEALQAQQLRLMRMNQDLRHRLATVESQGKAAILQKTELEAVAQARLQEVGSLQQELSRLKAQLWYRQPAPSGWGWKAEEENLDSWTLSSSLRQYRARGGDEEDGSEDGSEKRFTLQELRDVLQEKNELKAQVFLLEEELAYYKSEEEDEGCFADALDPDPPDCAPAAQPESGIRRL
ncbi:hypothetical protein NHX12_028739 [Muraenolepis orangiensis]|uniref:RILP-like protein 1 n=1 Tax=Muraenolepis orangiensis TaxID=630683 RepID=A0A9Q0ECQ1_9TELE|nr:hypothetical protein NHX12_028739 [Muraenolepis orangiensis]